MVYNGKRIEAAGVAAAVTGPISDIKLPTARTASTTAIEHVDNVAGGPATGDRPKHTGIPFTSIVVSAKGLKARVGSNVLTAVLAKAG